MLFKDKTLNAIIDYELSGLTYISKYSSRIKILNYCYVDKAINIMPWFYRYPIWIMIVLINIPAVVLYSKMYFNLEIQSHTSLWNTLSSLPGYSSLKKLIRTLALFSAYSQQNHKFYE